MSLGFEILSQALNATTVTEATQLDEQERQALYATLYHTDDNKRRVWAAEHLINAIRNEVAPNGDDGESDKPFSFVDWKGDYAELAEDREEVRKIVRIIDRSQHMYEQENEAMRRGLVAMYPEFAIPAVARQATIDITAILKNFGFSQAEALSIVDLRQISMIYEFAKLSRRT